MSYKHKNPWFVLCCKRYHRYYVRKDGTRHPFTHSYRVDVERVDVGRVRVFEQTWWFTGASTCSYATSNLDGLSSITDRMRQTFEEDMEAYSKSYEVSTIYDLDHVNIEEMLAKIGAKPPILQP